MVNIHDEYRPTGVSRTRPTVQQATLSLDLAPYLGFAIILTEQ